MEKCVKCGDEYISVKFIKIEGVECLRKECNKCEYVWMENCLDNKKEK